jgi:hypothetical protein
VEISVRIVPETHTIIKCIAEDHCHAIDNHVLMKHVRPCLLDHSSVRCRRTDPVPQSASYFDAVRMQEWMTMRIFPLFESGKKGLEDGINQAVVVISRSLQSYLRINATFGLVRPNLSVVRRQSSVGVTNDAVPVLQDSNAMSVMVQMASIMQEALDWCMVSVRLVPKSSLDTIHNQPLLHQLVDQSWSDENGIGDQPVHMQQSNYSYFGRNGLLDRTNQQVFSTLTSVLGRLNLAVGMVSRRSSNYFANTDHPISLLMESKELIESEDNRGIKENRTLLAGLTEQHSGSFFVSFNDRYRDAIQSYERMKFWISWGSTALNIVFPNWSRRIMFYSARIVMTQSNGSIVHSESAGELGMKLVVCLLLCTIGCIVVIRIIRLVLYFVFFPYRTIVWMIQNVFDVIRLTFPNPSVCFVD